jgi:hypothetical protein
MTEHRVLPLFLFLLLPLSASAGIPGEPLPEHGAFVVREADGTMSCAAASREEAARINARPNVPLAVFGEDRVRAAAGLNIVLRGTTQLDANPEAKAAFERAAGIWESRIANPITVFVDVDFGTTRFGEEFGEDTIASASSDVRGGGEGLYAEVRGLMLTHADNAGEAAIYGLLPLGAIPTDVGDTTGVASPSILFRAIDGLPPVAAPEDSAPSIGFNSKFLYDFDPSNGISPGRKDFEGVVVHEIGHMLGFISRVGSIELGSTINAPSILDFFRFRPGINSGGFGTAQRIQSSGGEQVFFAGGEVLAFSTGRPDGTGGDEEQASHWKDDAITGVRIGIMDPTLSSGTRTELTDNDLAAFAMMGFAIVGSIAPRPPEAPTNLVATAISPSTIRLTWADNSDNETEFRVEQLTSSGFVDLGALSANTTAINVVGFSAGQAATFRVRARNPVGDSAYSNEASATTFSSTPRRRRGVRH